MAKNACRRSLSALLLAIMIQAAPATAQSINASVEYLEMKPGGSTTLYPWFAMRGGGTFTLMLIKNRQIINATAGSVKKQAGHCYAENVHRARSIVDAAHETNTPVIFFQEIHVLFYIQVFNHILIR